MEVALRELKGKQRAFIVTGGWVGRGWVGGRGVRAAPSSTRRDRPPAPHCAPCLSLPPGCLYLARRQASV